MKRHGPDYGPNGPSGQWICGCLANCEKPKLRRSGIETEGASPTALSTGWDPFAIRRPLLQSGRIVASWPAWQTPNPAPVGQWPVLPQNGSPGTRSWQKKRAVEFSLPEGG